MGESLKPNLFAENSNTVRLVAATEAHFKWLLNPATITNSGLALPEGGLADLSVIVTVRDIARRVDSDRLRATWLVVEAKVVVGLCGYKEAQDGNGEIEIGFNIAPCCQGRGLATRAVTLLTEHAANIPGLKAVRAETAVDNKASQAVLQKNGFHAVGSRIDVEDGKLILWKRIFRS